MNKKLIVVSLAGLLALGGITAIGAANGSGGGSLRLATETNPHANHGTSDNDGKENPFWAPGTYKESDEAEAFSTGFKPYWNCTACCTGSGPNGARYSLTDRKTLLQYSEIEIPALTKAEASDISSGDEIANVNTGKFKYVDQGVNGVKGKEGTSTPWFVKDSNKTAVYFSASGKKGAATNPTSNDGCAEFRFSTDAKRIKSVSFDYCYQNWGTGTWNGAIQESEPSTGWKSLVQFQTTKTVDGSEVKNYYGVADKLESDGSWHTIKIAYDNTTYWASSTFDNFTGFIFKFADLRGYIMVSNLTYELDPDTSSSAKLYDSATGKGYADFKTALSSLSKGTLVLNSDLSASDLSEGDLVTIAGDKDITIDLSGHNIDLKLADGTKTAEGYKSKRFDVHGKLKLTGEGEVIGSDDTLFQVYGQYYAFNLTNGSVTRSKLLGSAGKLDVDSNVTLKGDYKSIGILPGADQSNFITYTNGSSDGNSDFTQNTYKGDDFGDAIGYARNVVINFSGTDATKEGFYVSNDIRDKGYCTIGGKKDVYDDGSALPQINIKNAKIKSGSHIAGYVDLNVTDSKFDVIGTAFNVESGDVLFQNNVFNVELGVVDGAEIDIKEPDYFDVSVDGNATLYFNQGIHESACIDKAVVENNTFNTANTGSTFTNKLDSWSNVATFYDDENAVGANSVKAPEIKVVNAKNEAVGSVTKMSEMNYRVAITTSEESFNAYFKDQTKATTFNDKFGDKILEYYGMTNLGTVDSHSLEKRTTSGGATSWVAANS